MLQRLLAVFRHHHMVPEFLQQATASFWLTRLSSASSTRRGAVLAGACQ